MNGLSEDKRPDLLTHRYRPTGTNQFKCHFEQAYRLKQWIQDFIHFPNGAAEHGSDLDEYDSSGSEFSDNFKVVTRKCVLITGPPGTGKTSLVYTVASELKLHVVESHPSEKRDSKLFSMLKLTNQKGKINPIAKLFQHAHQQQPAATINPSTRRKRRKLAEHQASNRPHCLSLSDDISIILFDDIDVVFEEDGPFLKSLVEFIKESKRPVILTATQSVDYIKNILVDCEHIHLNKPGVDECAKLLSDVCKLESYHKLSKLSRCQMIANYFECDIRQCLNRIHFYGDKADQFSDIDFNSKFNLPKFTELTLGETENLNNNMTILKCYQDCSLLDLLDSTLGLVDRSTSLERWLDGKQSSKIDEYSFNCDLGEQIRESIIELITSLRSNSLMTDEESFVQRKNYKDLRKDFLVTSRLLNEKIKSRIETSDPEFYLDIVPLFGEVIKMEAKKKESCQINGGGSRRSRRNVSYLDSIEVYLNKKEIDSLSDGLLNFESSIQEE